MSKHVYKQIAKKRILNGQQKFRRLVKIMGKKDSLIIVSENKKYLGKNIIIIIKHFAVYKII